MFGSAHLAGAKNPPGYESTRAWLRDNDRFRRDVIDALAGKRPFTSREIPDTAVVPWKSSGWTHNRNVTQMLELLLTRGEVAIAGRVGRERLWDVPERVYPPVVVPSVDEAEETKNERRLAALGIARQRARAMPMEAPVHVGEAGEAAVVDDVKGEWRVDPQYLDDEIEGRTALLSPFDRLVHDRVHAQGGLFDFSTALRDVQACRRPPLGILRPPDPPSRPTRREDRRHGRPQCLTATSQRDPR